MKFAPLFALALGTISTALASRSSNAPNDLIPAEAPMQPVSSAHSAHTEMTQSETRAKIVQLTMQLVDTIYEMRSASSFEQQHQQQQQQESDKTHVRAKGDNDDDDTTSKLINIAASAIRPVIKEFANVVGSVLPAGAPQQLIKASANAVDSLLPLILKYAIGL
ncbi:hypothetical protein BX661DRAFT_173120 [Kickxella alabastrina]|uniref:uncharacterized protein n=1 Tax=Kickxella alabastrina TaxID=61397 RepID=UPI00222080CD|nr:uncharacterized protein BX661DRAFT_173120 [Kickxella alabastrina]KAI7822301.1 hypothetical protein BX661DRAFT_173120 [Kickxella alabastrina]KAJ1946782.1 hypothetical protein GGF37_000930 [Kickxella alabastrina]